MRFLASDGSRRWLRRESTLLQDEPHCHGGFGTIPNNLQIVRFSGAPLSVRATDARGCFFRSERQLRRCRSTWRIRFTSRRQTCSRSSTDTRLLRRNPAVPEPTTLMLFGTGVAASPIQERSRPRRNYRHLRSASTAVVESPAPARWAEVAARTEGRPSW